GRNGREFHRPAPRLPDAALDRLGQLPKVDMTMVDLAPCLRDADDRLGEVDIVEPGGLAPSPHCHAPAPSIEHASCAARERIAHIAGSLSRTSKTSRILSACASMKYTSLNVKQKKFTYPR